MIETIKIERKKQVLDRVSFSKATLHRYIKKGTFPPPICLGSRAVGFLAHEIDQYIIAAAACENLEQTVKKMLLERSELSSRYKCS